MFNKKSFLGLSLILMTQLSFAGGGACITINSTIIGNPNGCSGSLTSLMTDAMGTTVFANPDGGKLDVK